MLLLGAAIVLVVAGTVVAGVSITREATKGRALPTTATPQPASSRGPSSAWPGADSTGVPPGTRLHICLPTITESGHYDACEFRGSVTVRADNVTISRSLIKGRLLAGSGDQQHGLVVVDSTVDARGFGSSCTGGSCETPPAVSFANLTLERVDIFGAGHGVQTNGNSVIRDSWIHDLCCDNAAHKDGIISNGGSNVVVQHNNIACDVGLPGTPNHCSAALGLFGDFGELSHWTIVDNLFNTTGGYCTYGGSQPGKPFPTATHMVFLRNQYGRRYQLECGQYGPAAYFDQNAPGNLWADNVWAGSTRIVSAPGSNQ